MLVDQLTLVALVAAVSSFSGYSRCLFSVFDFVVQILLMAVVVLVALVAVVVLAAYRDVDAVALESLWLFCQESSLSYIWITSTYVCSSTLEFEITHVGSSTHLSCSRCCSF